MKKTGIVISILLVLAFVCVLPATAQNKAPDAIPGEVVYIPFPVAITVDGKLDDWAGIPVQKVDTGIKKSPDPKQNQVFDFALASDGTLLYIYMHSVDSNIVAGKHGKDTWNEDSMEFYYNFSSNLKAKNYGARIAQFNITANDIGKPKLTVGGNGAAGVKLNGVVFKTADGWAFEASVPLVKLTPEHGSTIGFQAQSNGATAKDRDSQLVWSKADKNNTSYQDPSVFGRGVFFKVGSADVPAPKQ